MYIKMKGGYIVENVYSKDDLLILLKKAKIRLSETKEDILGYCFEIKQAKKTSNSKHLKFCYAMLKDSSVTFTSAVEDYSNYYSRLLKLS